MTLEPIKGLGNAATPACNAVNTPPVNEPATAQKDEEVEGRDFSGSLA